MLGGGSDRPPSVRRTEARNARLAAERLSVLDPSGKLISTPPTSLALAAASRDCYHTSASGNPYLQWRKVLLAMNEGHNLQAQDATPTASYHASSEGPGTRIGPY